jgi:hypothetical protein
MAARDKLKLLEKSLNKITWFLGSHMFQTQIENFCGYIMSKSFYF